MSDTPVAFRDFQMPCGSCEAPDYTINFINNKKCLMCNAVVILQRVSDSEARLVFGLGIKNEKVGFVKDENIRTT